MGRLLRFSLRLIPTGMKLPILQGKLKGKRWIVGLSNHGCWLGSYEYEKQILFAEMIQEGSNGYTGNLSSNGCLKVKTVSLDDLISKREIPPQTI